MPLTATDLELIRATAKDAMRDVLAEVGLLQDLITPARLAKELGRSRSTIYNWIQNGQVTLRAGFISRRELLAAVKNGLPIRRVRRGN